MPKNILWHKGMSSECSSPYASSYSSPIYPRKLDPRSKSTQKYNQGMRSQDFHTSSNQKLQIDVSPGWIKIVRLDSYFGFADFLERPKSENDHHCGANLKQG